MQIGQEAEIEDNSRKIGALLAKLNSGDISKNAADKLVQLCQALDNGDFGTALQNSGIPLGIKSFNLRQLQMRNDIVFGFILAGTGTSYNE